MQINRQCFCCEKKINHCGSEGDDNIQNHPDNATY
jgi:hypothetical protein